MYVYLLTEVAAYRNLWVIGRDFSPQIAGLIL